MKYLLFFLILLFVQIKLTGQDHLTKKQLVEEYYTNGIALRSAQKDSSYYYFDRAYQYAMELEEYSDGIEVLLSTILTSSFHYDLISYKRYLTKFENLLQQENVRNNLEDVAYYESRFVFEKGSYFYDRKEYQNAGYYFRKYYDTCSVKDPTTLSPNAYAMLVHTLNYLGLIYTNTDKYDLAEDYFMRSLEFVETNKTDQSNGLKRATLHLLSKLYTLTKRYKEADVHLENVLKDYKKLYVDDKEYKNNIIAIYRKLVYSSVGQNDLQGALSYLKQGQQYLLDEDPFFKSYLVLFGDVYMGLKDKKNALENYNKALYLFKEYYQNEPHQDVAEVYGKIAELHLKQENYQEGLKAIHNAFNTSGSNIQINSDQENPNPEKVFSKTQLLYLLDVKLQLLSGLFQSSEANSTLEFAIQTERDMLKTFDLLKKEFDSKLDKQFLAEKVYPMFEHMLEVVHMAYKKNGSKELVELALNITEKSKDFILLEALRSVQATRYGNVPKDVLDRESQLRAQITHVEKEIFDATDSETGFSDDLFKLKQEYYSLLDSIKIKYPQYHNLKYQETTLNLKVIRNQILEDNSTLVSYSMTKDYLYALVLNDDKEDFLKLPFSEVDRVNIRSFYKLLSTPSIRDENTKVYDLGSSLHDKILKEVLTGYDSENLTIIPDGELHYLPFDLLVDKGNYLLKTKSIGYGNSITSLLELRKKQKSDTNRVLAFAPGFDDKVVVQGDRQFGKLLYNDDEVSKIGAFYDTETVLDKEATLASFKAKTSNFNILHLATHASANDVYPDYSYLAFSQQEDNAEGNILYIKDLYNTSLNADMVTLSACQTGIGKLQKGQGMLSLSKGFYYAGAKSLVNTLWKINDKSSVKLMKFFYEGLSKGKSKTKALRDAKLKYLESTEDNLLQHPYYWSAFVVSGDISPITHTFNYWWYLGGAVLLLSILYLIVRHKRRKIKA